MTKSIREGSATIQWVLLSQLFYFYYPTTLLHYYPTKHKMEFIPIISIDQLILLRSIRDNLIRSSPSQLQLLPQPLGDQDVKPFSRIIPSSAIWNDNVLVLSPSPSPPPPPPQPQPPHSILSLRERLAIEKSSLPTTPTPAIDYSTYLKHNPGSKVDPITGALILNSKDDKKRAKYLAKVKLDREKLDFDFKKRKFDDDQDQVEMEMEMDEPEPPAASTKDEVEEGEEIDEKDHEPVKVQVTPVPLPLPTPIVIPSSPSIVSSFPIHPSSKSIVLTPFRFSAKSTNPTSTFRPHPSPTISPSFIFYIPALSCPCRSPCSCPSPERTYQHPTATTRLPTSPFGRPTSLPPSTPYSSCSFSCIYSCARLTYHRYRRGQKP